jgi:molecular chaperone HtpG
MLKRVIDSPDIPLNAVSGLQADAAVKKISNYITRKVADKLKSLFTETVKILRKNGTTSKSF